MGQDMEQHRVAHVSEAGAREETESGTSSGGGGECGISRLLEQPSHVNVDVLQHVLVPIRKMRLFRSYETINQRFSQTMVDSDTYN